MVRFQNYKTILTCAIKKAPPQNLTKLCQLYTFLLGGPNCIQAKLYSLQFVLTVCGLCDIYSLYSKTVCVLQVILKLVKFNFLLIFRW